MSTDGDHVDEWESFFEVGETYSTDELPENSMNNSGGEIH